MSCPVAQQLHQEPDPRGSAGFESWLQGLENHDSMHALNLDGMAKWRKIELWHDHDSLGDDFSFSHKHTWPLLIKDKESRQECF